MFLLGPLLLFPIAFVAVGIVLLLRRKYEAVVMGIAFAVVGVAATMWAINQSRSSTAGIGYLGLPFVASLLGFIGFAFGANRGSPKRDRRIASWLSLVAAVLLTGFIVRGGFQTRDKNKTRDIAQDAFSAEIARNRESIDSALKQRPGNERAYLDSAIRAHMNDHAFLLAALPHDSISPDVLDTLAESPDLNIALEAVRNHGTRSATLERVYRTKTYPDYFFQALAANRNTPPAILRELRVRPRTIGGLEVWLAGNPSTPKDVLSGIADSTREAYVISQLLENPSADCAILSKLAKTLMRRQQKDADDPNVARLAEKVPEVCASAKDSAERS